MTADLLMEQQGPLRITEEPVRLGVLRVSSVAMFSSNSRHTEAKRVFRAATWLLTLVPELANAQTASPVRVPDDPTCGTCRITVTTVATLGDTDGPGALAGVPIGIRVDGRGRFWLVGGAITPGGPTVYDPGGRFLRVAGRHGRGPGEFETVTDAVPLPGDSVLVMDYDRRATVFGPDLSAVRHMTLGAAVFGSVVINWPTSIVGFDHYGPSGRGGPVLHFMAFDSTPPSITRSFGPDWKMPDFKAMAAASRILAPSATGFWSVGHEFYRLEHWTRDGVNDRQFERVPVWPERTSEGLGKPDQAPPTVFRRLPKIVADCSGCSRVSRRRPGEKDGRKGAGELRISAFSQERMFRTVVEVLDPKAGRVVARRQLDEWIIAALPEGRAVVYTVDTNDIPRLRVVRLTLNGVP